MNYRRLQVYFFLVIFFLALILTFFLFKPFLATLALSGVLAILMWPIYGKLLKLFKQRRSLAAGAVVLIALVLILLPLTFLTASLVTEAAELFARVRVQPIFSDVQGTLDNFMSPEAARAVADEVTRVLGSFTNYAQPVLSSVTTNVVLLLSNTVAILFGLFLTLFALYYFLKDGPAFKKELLNLSPLADVDDNVLFVKIRDAIWAVAFGQFVISMVKGLVGGLAFWLLGIQAPVFWGAMIAFANFIPGIGTALVTVPFIIYLFFTGQYTQALILAISSILVIGLVDNFLTPQLINSRINIHPLLILLSMLGGLSLFGFFGIFFGPIVLSVTMALIDIYKKEFRESLEKI